MAGPSQLIRHNRTRAVTISANLAPGYTLGDALDYLEEVVRSELPATAQLDYRGESLEFKERPARCCSRSGRAVRRVPRACGAVRELRASARDHDHGAACGRGRAARPAWLTGMTLNIYSQIGIIMLVGIAAKNGVLIVEFVNQLRDKGLDFDAAILEAARIRFRPVVMTATCTLMGSLPLIFASGPGAVSRTTLGIVIFSGVSLATVLTLFVVPAFYQLLARGTGSPNEVAARLETMKTQTAVQ
jgi:multidrug efflux pump